MGPSRGSSRGFHRTKRFQQGVPVGVPAVTIAPFVTETMKKAVAALVGSVHQLKPYTAIKGKAREDRHDIQTIMRELLVDQEIVVLEGGGGWYIRFARNHDDEECSVVRAIGL